jgi:hypothetical protein
MRLPGRQSRWLGVAVESRSNLWTVVSREWRLIRDSATSAVIQSEGAAMADKTLEEKLEEANDAVEKAAEVRDEAIQDLMEADFAYSEALEVWGKLNDKSVAEARAFIRKLN